MRSFEKDRSYAIVRWRSLLILALPGLLNACLASSMTYRGKMEPDLYRSDFIPLLEELKGAQDAYGEKDRLLWYLDLCAVAHYAGAYRQSNDFCQAAARWIEAHAMKSIREETAAMLADDRALSYQSTFYEGNFLHTIGMLNYLLLNDEEEALVEARKLDERINLLLQKEDDIRYQDPLGRYLSALIHESTGAFDDAFIDDRLAFEAYRLQREIYGVPIPWELAQDLLRMARKSERYEEERRYRQAYSIEEGMNPFAHRKGELVIVVESGFSPYKIPKVEKKGLKRELPAFIDRPPYVQYVRARALGSKRVVASATVLDLGRIVQVDLDRRIERIVRKSTGRALVKTGVTLGAQQLIGPAAGFLLGGILLPSGEADLRCWSTLPARILMLRIPLPPGRHGIALKFYSHYNSEIFRQYLSDVPIAPGRRTFRVIKTP
ncbi:MAG: hypothetical protein D6812_10620 [Deltaproteobacteria bacterium]|nr:MAG: hypothetical protein D6812_10620 [Deltaproteobacteria bacterium]